VNGPGSLARAVLWPAARVANPAASRSIIRDQRRPPWFEGARVAQHEFMSLGCSGCLLKLKPQTKLQLNCNPRAMFKAEEMHAQKERQTAILFTMAGDSLSPGRVDRVYHCHYGVTLIQRQRDTRRGAAPGRAVGDGRLPKNSRDRRQRAR